MILHLHASQCVCMNIHAFIVWYSVKNLQFKPRMV